MKVLLIDDHALFREGLMGLLNRRGIDIKTVGDGRQGLTMIDTYQPDVILLDLRMPEIGGLELLEILAERKVDAPIVMLTTSSDENDLAEALQKGARGYLLKDMEPDELVVALRDIVSGKTVVAPDLTAVLADLVKHGDNRKVRETPSPFNSLTPREMEILSELAKGQSNKVIARNLNISDGTVKLHVKAILRKLNVHSRVEAAVMAVEKGLYQKSRGY